MKEKQRGLTHISNLISAKTLKRIKGPTAIQKRLIDAAVADIEQPDLRSVLYQHTVFCQTSLPYRNPGDEVRTWERLNGETHLKVLAGDAMHPEQRCLVPIGLPFGPKCRLVLMHINQRALVTQSAVIDMGDSLTSFVRRVLRLDTHGRNINMVKDQLGRLSASSIRLGVIRDGHALTLNSQIVSEFDIWFPKNEHQRVLWPSTVQLSRDYFESLLSYAVPLDERHIAALSHNAMALDIYQWLAQRLHRVPTGKPAFISWAALHGQFGQGYNPQRLDKFRAVFKVALKQVLTVYKEARITEDPRHRPRLYSHAGHPTWREPAAKGLTLYCSPPPVPARLKAIS